MNAGPRGALEQIVGAGGFAFDAWREPAREARRGGLVIAHAIWGVTPHLRSLAADFAEAGWEVLIPSLFDRFRPGVPDRDTDPADLDLRMAWGEATSWGATCLPDMVAAIAALKPPVAVIGFCFGGTVAWLSACRLHGIAAAVSFYGGQVWDHRDEQPRCPVMLHFGREDELIPPGKVDDIVAAHEELPIHAYPPATPLWRRAASTGTAQTSPCCAPAPFCTAPWDRRARCEGVALAFSSPW